MYATTIRRSMAETAAAAAFVLSAYSSLSEAFAIRCSSAHRQGGRIIQTPQPWGSFMPQRFAVVSTPPITRTTTTRTRTTPKTSLDMSLIPLSADEIADLISADTTPTALQYAAYWGRTPRERYNRFLETALVSILGMVFSYCLSFVLGGFAATLLGTIFFFWAIFTPQLQAIQRNWEFLGGRPLLDYYSDEDSPGGWFGGGSGNNADGYGRGLYGALFLGCLEDFCVVEYSDAAAKEEFDLADFTHYTMATDEMEQFTGNPYLLRVRLADSQGRKLQVHTRLSEEYLDLLGQEEVGGEPYLGVAALLLSTSKQFRQLAALSDIYVPAVQLYIGDYPYLHREGIEYLLATDDDVWNVLEQEQIAKENAAQRRLAKRKQPPSSKSAEIDDDEEDDDDGNEENNFDSNEWRSSVKSRYGATSWNPSTEPPAAVANDNDWDGTDAVPVRRRGQRRTGGNRDKSDYF